MKNIINSISVVILVGGTGSRFSPITEPPKQLSKLNKNLILMNIINNFRKFGFNHFIFPLGAKKEYFIKFFNSKKNIKNFNFNILKKNFKDNEIKFNMINISFFDAGLNTTKLMRISKSYQYTNSEDLLITYGDDLADVNLKGLVSKYLLLNKKKAIVTIYKKKSQYGHLVITKNGFVKKFIEKPPHQHPINIGFYLLPKKILTVYKKRNYELENNFLPMLTNFKLLVSYEHNGYFYSINDKKELINAKKNTELFFQNLRN
jgi:glucose-1-phosphate cytidylyltransferase